jgi:hypothetical protein
MATVIEQLEAAGVLNASDLNDDVKKRINEETSDKTVKHLIKFHKTVTKEHPDPKSAPMDPDGGML